MNEFFKKPNLAKGLIILTLVFSSFILSAHVSADDTPVVISTDNTSAQTIVPVPDTSAPSEVVPIPDTTSSPDVPLSNLESSDSTPATTPDTISNPDTSAPSEVVPIPDATSPPDDILIPDTVSNEDTSSTLDVFPVADETSTSEITTTEVSEDILIPANNNPAPINNSTSLDTEIILPEITEEVVLPAEHPKEPILVEDTPIETSVSTGVSSTKIG